MMIGSRTRYSIRFIIVVIVCIIVVFNLFFSYNLNGRAKSCQKKLVLARLAEYYEKLLSDRGITQELITNEERGNSKRIFNIFHDKEVLVNKLNEQSYRTPQRTVTSTQYSTKPSTKSAYGGEINNMQTSSLSRKIKEESLAHKGLLVDWWFDICIKRTTSEQLWHPLFPRLPQRTTIYYQTGDKERHIGSHFRRIYGFIQTNVSGKYDFKLLSRDGAEMLFLDTKVSLEYIRQATQLNSVKEMFHLKLTKELMDYQDNKIALSEMFSTEKRSVWLKADNLYYVEILQAGKHFAKYQIQWRVGGGRYEMIGRDYLLHTKQMSAMNTPSQILTKYPLIENFRVKDDEQNRLSFINIPILRLTSSNFACAETSNEYKNITFLYQGYRQYVENLLTYPKEFFDFTQTPARAILLNEHIALKIAHKTFEQLNTLSNGVLELVHVVHVMSNVDKSFKPYKELWKNYFFVELDVKYIGKEAIYRSSHFVKMSSDNRACFMEDFVWKEDAVINLLTPIRNQKVWLEYLIQMLQDVITQSNEKNVNLILIDNNSTDGNYEKILKASNLKHTYLNMASTSFNKVKALNYGLKHIKDDNAIAFVLDLHLQLPLNIFDRIRKLTIQGKTAFSPTLLKLACGEHEQYTELEKSSWLDYGTGMIALYKSDWTKVRGFNEKLFNKKWGGEDWEVIDRIYKNGLFVIHGRMPRFYHIHHSKDKMWDKS